MTISMQYFVSYLFKQLKPKEADIDPILEQEFAHVFKKVKDYTMTSKERAYALYKSLK
jgi:hypothetical protein